MTIEQPEKFRIIVVDDDTNLLELYRAILTIKKPQVDEETDEESTIYEIVLCEQGDEGVEKVRESVKEKNPFTIAFLDLHMPPGPDGVWTAENMRQLDPYIEIVVVTGYSAIQPRDITSRVSPEHRFLYIQKPFSPVELIQLASSLSAKWLVDRETRKINEELETRVKERTAELAEANKLLKQEIEEHKKAREALLLDESRLETLFRLSQLTEASIKDLTYFTLQEGIRLNKSKIGYIGFLHKDQPLITFHLWPKSNDNKGNSIILPSDCPCFWLEALKEGKPVIRNISKEDDKKYPEGLAGIFRHMDVPVFEGHKIVALAGVANKETDYDEADARQLTLLMDGVWKLIQKKEAREALRQAEEDFIAILTHDLKSPLASMMSLVELLGDSRFGEIPPNKMEYTKLLRSCGDILLTLINNIVISSGLEYGEIDYNFEKCNLSELLREVYYMFEPLAKQANINLWYSCPDDIYVNIDSFRIQQVLNNLISNSLKYTPADGSISIIVTLDKDKVLLEVADTGKGIPEKEQEKLFDKFVHMRSDRRGTGLGLYIVKTFLESHGSDVWVKSSPGKGAHFFFHLPLVKK